MKKVAPKSLIPEGQLYILDDGSLVDYYNRKGIMKEAKVIHPNGDYLYKFVINGRVRQYRFAGFTSSGRVILYNVETDKTIDVSKWQFDHWLHNNKQEIVKDEQGSLFPGEKVAEAVKAEEEKIDRSIQQERQKTDESAQEYYLSIVKELKGLSSTATERVKQRIGRNPRTLADEIHKVFIEHKGTPGEMIQLLNDYHAAEACYKKTVVNQQFADYLPKGSSF